MKQNNMLHCTITSPKETKHYTNVQSVILPAFSGQAQILPGHAESFLLLEQGNIVLRYSNRQIKTVHIPAGECYATNEAVVVVL